MIQKCQETRAKYPDEVDHEQFNRGAATQFCETTAPELDALQSELDELLKPTAESDQLEEITLSEPNQAGSNL